MRWLLVLVSVLMSLGAVPAIAAERALDLLDPAVSYTADFTVSSDKGTYSGLLWHQPGRERRSYMTKGGSQTILIRRDLDSAWMMKPSGKWYVGLSLRALGVIAGGIDNLTVSRTPLGDEDVNGHRTTRYRVVGQGPRGGRFDGDAWFTREGIMIKAAGTLTDPDGRHIPVQTELSRLMIGRVDPKNFELPSGWMGMDLRSVPAESLAQALESLKPLLEGR
ncbi:conserved exported hypothetical protein [Magnetospirillum sp. LM-5]|uniref:hypothetical protein n=1 Tax=Magnetospirillum sp. LM-5 TaxID=2681466 RepID=UPI001384CDAB|nr:hypothetical protein [Magnetospirillum sp. LM-5]CAA7625731.1 conserved exported hypothetical protein [Magnetospirillum sp. LM-5]